jgi:hypothetical protein
MCRANAEAGHAMTTLSGPRQGRDGNRNGRASALYLCDRDPGVPAASVRISYSGARASFVREAAKCVDQIDPNQPAHPWCQVEITKIARRMVMSDASISFVKIFASSSRASTKDAGG